MGVKGSHAYTHSISGVSIGELFQIALCRKKSNQSPLENGIINDPPTIDIDASWVYRSTMIAIETRFRWMINLGLELVKVGFNVVFVCDGEIRHHSKRATIERKSKYQKSIIDGYIRRSELMKLAEKRLGSKSIEEVTLILNQEAKLSSKIKAMEEAQQCTTINVGEDFFLTIQKLINELPIEEKGNRNGSISVIKSKFQADSVLAYRCITKKNDVVLSSDSDLAALCGSACLGIKSFKFNERRKNDKLIDVTLYTPSMNTLIKVSNSIHVNMSSTRIKLSDFTFFDEKDMRIRGLIAVGLGCDVYLSGIRQLGRVTLRKFIDNENEVTYDSLLDFYYNHITKKKSSKKNNTSIENNNIRIEDDDNVVQSKEIFIDAMNIYVDTFLYEPINYYSNEIIVNEKPRYLTKEKPTKLHRYIEEFSNNSADIEIYDSINTLMECNGSGCGKHTFLSYEPQFICCTCNQLICFYCCLVDNEKNHCYQCFLSEVAVVQQNIVEQPSIVNMRSKLREVGFETGSDENVNDITDLYESIIENKKVDVYDNGNFMNSISMPLFPSSHLDTEKIIFRFDLRNGGSFIRNSCCTSSNRYKIICLLSKLVKCGNSEHNFISPNNKIFSILPDILVDFAQKSRLHSGYRLLKRAVRHAMDPEGVSILTSNCCIISYENTIGIHINHEIKASMKKDRYNVKLSFTSTEILAVSCTCKAGAIENEKVICVHILPVILQLSLLLFDGLAEHLLCELSNEISPFIENEISKEELNELKEAILLLKRANSDCDSDNLFKCLSIKELLSKYSVGTENYKTGPGPPKDIFKLGPLRNIKFISPLMKAKEIISKIDTKETIVSNNEGDLFDDNEVELFDDNEINKYIPYNTLHELILFTINHFNKSAIKSSAKSTFENCIGFKILKLRSQNDESLSSKKINVLKRKLLVAISNACNEFRIDKKPKNLRDDKSLTRLEDNNNNEQKHVNLENNNGTCINENEIVNNNNECEKISNNNFHTNMKKNNNYVCCAFECKATSANAPNLTFHKVPKIPKNKITEQSSNNIIETYQRKKYIRKEWLKRLGISSNNSNNNLRICSKHDLELQDIQYTWINKLKEEELTMKKIRVPRKQNEPPIKTRQQHKKRKSIFVENIHNKNDISPDPDFELNDSTNNMISDECTTNNVTFDDNININIDANAKKKPRKYCAYVGCRINNLNPIKNLKFCCIPKKPKLLQQNARNCQRLQHAKREYFFKQYCKSIGVKVNDKRKDIRICNQHQLQTVTSILHWHDKDDKKQSTKIVLDLPAAPSTLKQTNREGKGLGIDRFLCQTITKAKEENGDFSWALSLQQTVAMNDEPEMVHRSVAKAVGFDIHDTGFVKYQVKKIKEENKNERNIVRLDIITNDIIKQQTGFESKAHIISFILIVCNADIDAMIQTKQSLNWFEEWFFFFERCYGRGLSRWCDFEDKYKRSESFLRVLFDKKLRLVVACRSRWPMYTNLDEDEALRSECWKENYAGKRVVMWDNTCIHLPKPTDPEAQRNTYSAYYAGNVGKGAIFIQLCGWMGTFELWVGAVSDSDYFIRSGILQQQKKYIPIYDIDKSDVQWINVLDKGYRVTSAAWRTGKQFVLQPSFAKSDRKFSSLETLRSAAIASDRGANERAVRLSKMSGQLHDGITGNQSLERLSDLWLTWSFQCNFLYKPVL